MRMCHCARAFAKFQLQENVPLCPGLVKMTTATGECAIVPRFSKMTTATGECATVPRLGKNDNSYRRMLLPLSNPTLHVYSIYTIPQDQSLLSWAKVRAKFRQSTLVKCRSWVQQNYSSTRTSMPVFQQSTVHVQVSFVNLDHQTHALTSVKSSLKSHLFKLSC